MVCVDRAVCLCCNPKTGISAARGKQDWQYNLSMQKLQYSYVHRKQESKWIWRHVQPIAMSVISDIFSAPKFRPILGRIENMTSLITWEIRPCCASTAIFVLEWFAYRSASEYKDITTHLSFTLFASWLSSFFPFSFSFCCDESKMHSRIEVDEPHLLERVL